MSYGIYTVADHNYFPGAVASINALRHFGYHGDIAVFDIGMRPWMRRYLRGFERVALFDMEPICRVTRYVDVTTDLNPVHQNWTYKAFGIIHSNLFSEFTYIDADYLPLCNLQEELQPHIRLGEFVGCSDSIPYAEWDVRHKALTGVTPGRYRSMNAGFFSCDAELYGPILHEWRNQATRRQIMRFLQSDQVLLNLVLDKYGIQKTLLNNILWNQDVELPEGSIQGVMAVQNLVTGSDGELTYVPTGERMMGWHSAGRPNTWCYLGLTLDRFPPERRQRLLESAPKMCPAAIVETYRYFLFMDEFNSPLVQEGDKLVAR